MSPFVLACFGFLIGCSTVGVFFFSASLVGFFSKLKEKKKKNKKDIKKQQFSCT